MASSGCSSRGTATDVCGTDRWLSHALLNVVELVLAILVCPLRAGASMACFADLPLELIEAIAHWIDDRLDVLAFALTSPSIGALLSPRHTQLRVIRCTKRTLCVWRFLASNNALSRNVRVLEIDSISAECAPDEFCTPLAECPHCFPNPVWTAEHRTAARKVERATLARALRNLVNLTKFTHRNTTVHGNEGREMWKAVAMCPNIETLSIAGNGHQYIWKCAVRVFAPYGLLSIRDFARQ
ncbi:hypothetical protein FA95DRAFT_932005 [Auriscalpium vulgare]|uniref:Uncharacterized protein n=1 Tax=Auriscalpium vulgare TaxID=40419 RepID=A0ACB8SBB0_9AGAM|nr:hypothetical protein FA95DRAFT_932005 [Auriscalpium vulgare]